MDKWKNFLYMNYMLCKHILLNLYLLNYNHNLEDKVDILTVVSGVWKMAFNRIFTKEKSSNDNQQI